MLLLFCVINVHQSGSISPEMDKINFTNWFRFTVNILSESVLEDTYMFKTVLFPVDRSREAREAAEKVINIVKTYQARLVVMSVLETNEEGHEPFHPEMTSPEVVSQLLEEAKTLFAEQGIEVETIQRQGHPAFTICDVADDIGADLIVIGCRGTGLTEEGATDSVSTKIINLSPCPILVVP